MIIKEIGIKGFKSFGNNEQVLRFDEHTGKLILLVGRNGAGKSSLIESTEYVLYGKVKSNKAKKWARLGSLPNRINGELCNRIIFNANSTDVELKRGISPNILELTENGVVNERAGKANIDDRIESYIGMDVETFKSFISMSVNDFKNFISLSNEEKKMLLDKLFNLEVITTLFTILKDVAKANRTRMASLDSEIATLDRSITSIRESIQRSKEKKKEQVVKKFDEQIASIKEEMLQRRETYEQLKNDAEKIKELVRGIENELDVERRKAADMSSELKNVEKELSLYDQSKCPTCATPFTSEHFTGLRNSLVEKKESILRLMEEMRTNVTGIKERQEKLRQSQDETNKLFNEVSFFLRDRKQQLDNLIRESQKPVVTEDDVDVSEFENNVKDLSSRMERARTESDTTKEKELCYKELAKVFSEDGARKVIIKGIVKPINSFISENIKKMGLPFEVKLDEGFNAEIKSLGDTVDADSLSTGETRRINIAILIAYLKMIRTKRHINILFLDEIFSSIDFQGIQDILVLLKQFANDYNINIFVVHHAIMNNEYFDRIIKVDKNVFTTLTEVNQSI
jgi:DNA repair exonuclease SbcCD ATPase subunit